MLRSKDLDRDLKRKRDIIKKVIAYMTLGIDVSLLFSDMVMVRASLPRAATGWITGPHGSPQASSTTDFVVKKMVYLYLCTYAESNPELSLLAINTLTKDWYVCLLAGVAPQRAACPLTPPPPSVNEDPTIRGLALRSLSSLRLPTIVEYVVPVLQRALRDPSPYVRKTAVLGIVKLHHLAPHVVQEADMVDTLYTMLRDRDAQVVTNCIVALREIMADEGGMAVNQAIVHHLVNRLREVNEWGQCVVLELVAEYKPESQVRGWALRRGPGHALPDLHETRLTRASSSPARRRTRRLR